jgi:hypothetical protein
MQRACLTVAVVLGVGACNANHALDTSVHVNGHDAGPVGAQDAAPAGTPGLDAALMSGGDVAVAGSGPACAATCGTPAGPVAALSDNEAYTSLAGRWQICSGRDLWAMVGAPSDTIGIEYTADQNMYYLVDGPDGPTRGAGFAYQLTYDVLPSGQFDMHPEPNAGFFGFLSYSPCPREIQIAPFAYNEAGSNLVPLAGASAPATGQPPPSCVATCQTPAGDVAPLPTIDAVYSTFEGRWLICEGLAGWQGVGAPSDVVGVEFGPASAAPTANGSTGGGNMYYLVQQSGKLVRGAGGAYQLTYDVSPEGPSYQLNMHPTPNSAFGTSFRYSPCPRELELNGVGGPSTVIIPVPSP